MAAVDVSFAFAFEDDAVGMQDMADQPFHYKDVDCFVAAENVADYI